MTCILSLKRLALSFIHTPVPKLQQPKIQEIMESICREEFHDTYQDSRAERIRNIAKIYQRIIFNRQTIDIFFHDIQKFTYSQNLDKILFFLPFFANGQDFFRSRFLECLNPFFVIKRLKESWDSLRFELLIRQAAKVNDSSLIELLCFAFYKKMTKKQLGLAFHCAVECNVKQSIDLILQLENLPIGGEFSFGSAFHYVAVNGNTEILQKFLDCKEKVGKMPGIFCDNCRQYSLDEIFFFAQKYNVENFKILLQCPDIVDRIPVIGSHYSFTKDIGFAARDGNSEILELLLQCESKFKDVPIRGEFSFSRALWEAASEGKSNTFRQLLNCKNQVRQMEVEGFNEDERRYTFGSALVVAAASIDSSILEMILSCEEKMVEVSEQVIREAIFCTEKFDREENQKILIAYLQKKFGRTYKAKRKREIIS